MSSRPIRELRAHNPLITYFPWVALMEPTEQCFRDLLTDLRRASRGHLIRVLKRMLSAAYLLESEARAQTTSAQVKVDILLHDPAGARLGIELEEDIDSPCYAVLQRHYSILESNLASSVYRIAPWDALFETAHVLHTVSLRAPGFLSYEADEAVAAICAQEHFVEALDQRSSYSNCVMRVFGDPAQETPRGSLVILETKSQGNPDIHFPPLPRNTP